VPTGPGPDPASDGPLDPAGGRGAGGSRDEDDGIEIRAATPADHPAIVALAGAALGWRPEDPNGALFRWKHVDNPFGASPMWVAVADDQLVAFRTLLRWRFVDRERGPQLAVRAVDTATHPDHQGRGLFTRLTRHALAEVGADGVDFVFNTPNAASRPGYLKMGWVDVGRVPVAVALAGPTAALRLVRARVPAGKWSIDATVGEDAADALADAGALEALLGGQPAPDRLRTHRSAAFLRWRYAMGPLRYRVLLRTGRVEDGFVVFRLRRRGAAVEATIGDVLVPGGDRRLERELLRAVRREARPDYLIRVQRPPITKSALRLPRQGPRLTWRAVGRTDAPPLADWDLRLGDIELF
jgi:GNAT superfamily N-acetyltransferase